MGQAKRRGTLEQRIAQAIARDNLILAERNLALTKSLTKDETKTDRVAVVGVQPSDVVLRASRLLIP